MKLHRLLQIIAIFGGSLTLGATNSPSVRALLDGANVMLVNEHVSASFDRKSGDILSLLHNGQELLRSPAYLDWHDGRQQRLNRAVVNLVGDPETSTDGRAEIVFHQVWSGRTGEAAFDVSLHYLLRPGERALRSFVVFHHPASYPAAGIGQSRVVMRPRTDLFDTISVDDERTHPLPPGDTPVEVLGPKESMRFTSGPQSGQITDKYHYFTSAGDHFFHGWMDSKNRQGLWLVYGSTEDQNGGPTRQHNTAHWPGMLLKILTCGHYGAPSVSVPAGMAWTKLYGPWAFYLNGGSSLDALRADAARQAREEVAEYPPAWLTHPSFPDDAQRGTLSGWLKLDDPHAAPDAASGAWVGLAASGSDWQKQALEYQPWTRTDTAGRFFLKAVRPGTYTLHAFAPGVFDAFQRADVVIAAGEGLDLGTLDWRPLKKRRLLWQLGVPDRSAHEFKLGDGPRRWGRWHELSRDVPADSTFVIGRDDPAKHWPFAQSTRPKPDGSGWGGSLLRLRFLISEPLPAESQAVLRIAFAAAHNARLAVTLNGEPLGQQSRLGSDNALARAGVHGQFSTWELPFSGSRLPLGENEFVLELQSGDSPFRNVMYDCLRLEVEDAPATGLGSL